MPSKHPVADHNLRTTRRGTIKKRSLIWRWRRLFYAAGLALVLVVAGGAYAVSQIRLPDDPLKAPTQRQTTFICSADVSEDCDANNAIAQLHGDEDRSVVAYDQIPKVLREAVLSAEDRDFFDHRGVDPVGIARAAWADVRSKGARQGGSTITQQYVKNIYLGRERTLTRKAKEAVLAVKLEQKLSKTEILSRYLNTIYFGRGAYGVAAASRTWFGHDLSSMTLNEAAFLAGLIRAPQSADPYRGPPALLEAHRRRAAVLVAMRSEGYINAEQQRAALDTPLQWPHVLPPPDNENLGAVKGDEVGTKYFVEYVRQFLVRRFGNEAVLGGGLKVYTTVDLDLQKAAFDAVTSTLNRPGDPAAAIVAVDDQGRIKAMMGGTDFERNRVNLAAGREGGGSGRQPGSTFKAFALAEAVKEGFSLQSRFRAPSSIEIPNGEGLGQPWRVQGGLRSGAANLITATQYSVNTVYAQLVTTLGADKIVGMANELGVSESAALPAVPSVVLGSGEVSVLDMASAYSTFANEGRHLQPVAVTRVERPDGTVVDLTPDPEEVLTPDQAALVTHSLQKVISGGTGTAADIGRPAAGKTGTTQDNADAWFVGYTPKMTAAVWMGYPQGAVPMTDVHGIKVEGGTFPAQMWRKFMLAASAGTQPAEFRKPERLDAGILIDTGLRASSASDGTGSTRRRGSTSSSTAPRRSTSVPSTDAPATTSSAGSGSTSRPSPTTAPRSSSTAPATSAPRSSTSRPATTSSAPSTTAPP